MLTDERLRELRSLAEAPCPTQEDWERTADTLVAAVPELLNEIERLREQLNPTPEEAPDLGGWTADFEPFEDAKGYFYEPYLAYALFRNGRPVAYVQCGSGRYDHAHTFNAEGGVVYSVKLNEEDDPEWTEEDLYLVVARRWCEARLAEMAEDTP